MKTSNGSPPPRTCHTDPSVENKTQGETYLNTGTSRNHEVGERGQTAGKRAGNNSKQTTGRPAWR